MELTQENLAALLDRLDEHFDLEGRLASEPGLLTRATIPGEENEIVPNCERLVFRRYAVAYEPVQPESSGEARGDGATLRGACAEMSFNGQKLLATVHDVALATVAHDSARGLTIVVTNLVWRLRPLPR